MLIEEKILSFINDMGYIDNEHVLGILFYGSYLTGLNTENSDIDLHIIFDNTDPNHLIRGNKVIDGIRIEYFEKTLEDVYQTVNEDYTNQNNATLTIIGTSKIIYAKDKQIKRLQEYVVNKFSNPLPPLSDDEAKEQVSLLNNRLEKLENCEAHSSHIITNGELKALKDLKIRLTCEAKFASDNLYFNI